MAKPSWWNRLPHHHLKVVDVDYSHLHEAEALPEISEEKEMEELGALCHREGTWMIVATPCVLT